ncbi:hypothetical protein [Noviherbaspirillum galbum]|uniref:Uncharacterized protein n=1 Tax=Noviherbaspirillum galbum TaxID=2709383 RepID=A0A6B3SYX3_9BURK|nr:hypothetical protein [Noviherbaspirillum galbum]NEX63409.1 hypothetical protein [Noviherbaspirillum galbum]
MMNKPAIIPASQEEDDDEFHWSGSDDIFSRAGRAANPTTAQRAHALLNDLFESAAEGDPEACSALELGGFEGDRGVPLDIISQPDDAEIDPVPKLGKTERRKVALKSNYITLEDFEEGTERECFQLIYNHARFVLAKDTTPELMARGIQFFFCASDTEVTFVEAAAAISTTIRTDVILLRFQYEFWRRYMVFSQPFDWSAYPVPDRVMNQFAFAGMSLYADDVATILAREIWYRPGMTVDEATALIKEELPGKYALHADEKIYEVIDHLRHLYLLSQKVDSLYVTYKNPELQLDEWSKEHRQDASRSNIWWSRLF